VRRPRFLVALAAIVLAGATEAGISQWLPAYSERVLGYGKTSSGAALIAFSLAMAAGRLLASRLQRLSPYAMMLIPAGLCVALYLLGSLLPVPSLALAACVLVGLACSVLWPTNLGVTADHFPRGGASMFALLAGFGNIGCLVMPWIVGFVAEHTSLRTGLLVGTLAPVLLLLAGTAAWAADRRNTPVSP